MWTPGSWAGMEMTILGSWRWVPAPTRARCGRLPSGIGIAAATPPQGYWGLHVGYYGGVDYGGATWASALRGEWREGGFAYNTRSCT